MQRGRRPPLLAVLYAVGVYAAGLVTWAGLLSWGWPIVDAVAVAIAVAVLALWGTLVTGRATTAHRERKRRSKEDRVDR